MSKQPDPQDRPEHGAPRADPPADRPAVDDELDELSGGIFNTAGGGVFNTANYGDSPVGVTVAIPSRFDKLIR